MLLEDIKLALSFTHRPIGVCRPAEAVWLDLHPETRVAAQKRLTGLCALLIPGINGNEHVQIWIALALQTLQGDRELDLPSIDRHTDCHERTAQSLMSSRIRVAHTFAKWGAIVSLPGSTE